MLGIYNYTVILTYIGMLVSFLGLSFAMGGNIQAALLCLMISGVCDMFDGKIASTMERTKQQKRFGIQIDSLKMCIRDRRLSWFARTEPVFRLQARDLRSCQVGNAGARALRSACELHLPRRHRHPHDSAHRGNADASACWPRRAHGGHDCRYSGQALLPTRGSGGHGAVSRLGAFRTC